MKAYQGYMVNCMKKFRWLESFQMKEYTSKKDPLVIFGCYKEQCQTIIHNHQGPIIIVWMGKDANMSQKEINEFRNKEIIHVTWLKPLVKHLADKGVQCHLIKVPIKERPYPDPYRKLGSCVYTYLQKGKPLYHGSEMVESLELRHRLIVGDHSIDQIDWYNGMNNKFYCQVFIGLMLSSHVGGAMGILEMAVRGIRVVTNVLSLPNCIPWETKEDIELAVEEESKNIGKSNNGLVEEVYDHLADIRGCFDLDKLLV